MSVGRATEAAVLYAILAYQTKLSKELAELSQRQLDRSRRFRDHAEYESLLEEAVRLSDSQLTSFGLYEVQSTRYELLSGPQGASRVADPELLSTAIAPSADFCATGRDAFRRQKKQQIR